MVNAFFVTVVRGPALPARPELGVPALGVPGPRDDCRRPDDAAGRVPSDGFRRRRLLSTAPADNSRCRCWKGAVAAAGVAGAELRAPVCVFRADILPGRARDCWSR